MSEVTWYALTGSIRPCDEGDADVVDVDDYYTLANENASLAARVADLEAERDRAERLAAKLQYAVWCMEDCRRADREIVKDLAEVPFCGVHDSCLAAVRAVTRTPAGATPHATQGEGE